MRQCQFDDNAKVLCATSRCNHKLASLAVNHLGEKLSSAIDGMATMHKQLDRGRDAGSHKNAH